MGSEQICPLCRTTGFSRLYICTDHLVSKKEFEIIRCDACGFCLTAGVPAQSEIAAYYDSGDYISHGPVKRSVTEILYSGVRTIMLHVKARAVKRIARQSTKKILDIGAGTGHFVRKMRMAGWQSEGIEISAKARKAALLINGTYLFPSFADLPETDNRFGVITMWHVLEHLHEPDNCLKYAYDSLEPEGLLVIAVPNIESADACHYRDVWAAFDVPRHIWHFSIRSLTSMVARHGFRLLKISRMPFDSFYISVLSEKNRGERIPLIKGLLKGCWFWFSSMLKKGKSSSLIFYFRRL